LAAAHRSGGSTIRRWERFDTAVFGGREVVPMVAPLASEELGEHDVQMNCRMMARVRCSLEKGERQYRETVAGKT
jgi:hypothetical protein